MIPQHSSETNEHYTPAWIVEICREVLGGIQLDPATSPAANEVVKAETIFTQEDNGLLQDWSPYETVFLNPPGGLVDENGVSIIKGSKEKGREGCTKTGACGLPPGHKHKGVSSSPAVWWFKMAADWWVPGKAGIYLAFSLEILQSAQVFDGPHPFDFTCCALRDRIDFESVDDAGARVPGTDPTHANMLVLLSDDERRISLFREGFERHGKVR